MFGTPVALLAAQQTILHRAHVSRGTNVGTCTPHLASDVVSWPETMLRITAILNDGSPAVLKLEGKLLEPWIGELREACRSAGQRAATATLDLSGLSFADGPGTIALRDLRRRGVKFIGCSPLLAELLKESDQ